MDGHGTAGTGENAGSAAERAAALAALRRSVRAVVAPPRGRLLPFGIPALDGCLSGGPPLGVLHEVAPREEADAAAALGFVVALLARLSQETGLEAGTGVDTGAEADLHDMLIVVPEAAVLDGHGLAGLGLSPDRLLVLPVGSPRAALFALEEGLCSRGLRAVVGMIEAGLDLEASRRLQLAAQGAGGLLVVLRPAALERANAAATRWRIGAAAARRDRFGTLLRIGWEVVLVRCRNGRPGDWYLAVGSCRASFRSGWSARRSRASSGIAPVGAGPDSAFPDPVRPFFVLVADGPGVDPV